MSKNKTTAMRIKNEDRAHLIAESIKATFLNKKIGLYSSSMHIIGTCCDIHGSTLCIKDAKLKIITTSGDITIEKDIEFLMTDRSQKTLTLEEA